MMRYSMLKRIDNPQVQQLAQEKKYIALYVSMYLEFVTHFTTSTKYEEKQNSCLTLVSDLLKKSGLICLHILRNSKHYELVDVKATGNVHGFSIQVLDNQDR